MFGYVYEYESTTMAPPSPPATSRSRRRLALLPPLALLFASFAAAQDPLADDPTLVPIEDFSDPLHVWRTFGDPHMGGHSDGSFTVDRYERVGRFFGTIKKLPPRKDGRGGDDPGIGFFRAEAGALGDPSAFPDARTCQGLRLRLRTEGWNYKGFLLGFGTKKPPQATGRFSRARGYRAELVLPDTNGGVGSDEYVDVDVPFTSFTMEWNAVNGESIATCADDVANCPDDEALSDPRPIMIYAKGYEGTFDLRIRTIAAYGCDPAAMEAMSAANEDEEDPDEIVLEDFSQPGGPINEWTTMDDPVMGGKSHSSVEIERGVAAKFKGYCAVVPKLKAPGFVTMSTGKAGRFAKGKPAAFPDISNCDALRIEARSDTPYEGYYLSFGTDKAPKMHHGRGYKAPVDGLPSPDPEDADMNTTHTPTWASSRLSDADFGTVDLPFSSFSSYWNEGSGATIVACSEDDPGYCPTMATLRNVETISLWGEGVEGDVALDVRRITAVGCRGGRYAKMLKSLGVADDGRIGHTYGLNIATFLPGVALAGVLLAVGVVLQRWLGERAKKAGPYGEVPPISAEAEVNVLRSELVEMRNAMTAMGKGAVSVAHGGGDRTRNEAGSTGTFA